MPAAADFITASCQAAVFTPAGSVSVAAILTGLRPAWSLFDAEPNILLMPGMPEELPRVVLQSRSGEWKVEIAPARTAIHWAKTSPLSIAGPSLQDTYATASRLLQEYVAFADARVRRLAAVVNRYSTDGEPASFLASHFCKDKWLAAPFNRPASFELHAHKTYRLGGDFDVNSWVRNKTGLLTTPSGVQPVILVEQDVNTLQVTPDSPVFTPAQVASFFAHVTTGVDETLALYYPPQVHV